MCRRVTDPALRYFELSFTLVDVFPRHASPEDYVPVNEERLGEIGLDPDSLQWQ